MACPSASTPGAVSAIPPVPAAGPSYYLEDYVSHAQGFAAALNSMVVEGVFVKYPSLKVGGLIESGVTWLPASLWRLDKTWRGVRAETPWLEELPTETVRNHVRLTLQPFDAPPTEPAMLTLLEQLGSDKMLMFSSDYPHWHYDGDDRVTVRIAGRAHSQDLCRKPAGYLPSPEGDHVMNMTVPGSQTRQQCRQPPRLHRLRRPPLRQGSQRLRPVPVQALARAQADHRRPHPPGPGQGVDVSPHVPRRRHARR